MTLRPVVNPPNPWNSVHREWLDAPPVANLEIFEERAKSILSENDSPDLPFRWGLNPYRGCFHGCIYCYARPSHQYWDFGAGTDFERKIVVKTNAAEAMARRIEPYVPSPATRFSAMRALADAGIEVGVGIAPIIPGLNDSQIPEILKRAADSGAIRAFRLLLRLPSEVKTVFFGRLAQEYPDRVERVTNALKETQGGKVYRSGFGERGRGIGPRWDAIDWLFTSTCKKVGLKVGEKKRDEAQTTFVPPGGQLTLFGDSIWVRSKRV